MREALFSIATAQVLLENGADPNQHLILSGSTVLLEATGADTGRRGPSANVNLSTVLTLLFQHGADPNLAHALTGQTALMIAAQYRRIDLMKLLLEHGADVAQVNLAGQTVLDILGIDPRDNEAVKLCVQYMGSVVPSLK